MSAQDFWSRRRAAVEAEADEDRRVEAETLLEADRAKREAQHAERSDAEILAELNLPDPDSLGLGDDFKAFLGEAVPARIRTRALRRLWTSNPVLANLDGLVDHGEDFSDAAMAVPGIQTAYQVGKGMQKHVEELARLAERAASPAEATDRPETSEEPALTLVSTEAEVAEAEIVAALSPEADPQATEAPEPAVTLPEPATDPIPAPVRRMRFAFDPAPQVAEQSL